jgi:L-2-hydroxyglutarate oxidase
LEPYSTGIRGIHVPGTGIVDYARVAEKYAELIISRGGNVFLSHEVTGIKNSGSRTTLETTQGEISAKFVINCAGLLSDRISRIANAKLDLKIVPFRGEYYELTGPFESISVGKSPAGRQEFIGQLANMEGVQRLE